MTTTHTHMPMLLFVVCVVIITPFWWLPPKKNGEKNDADYSCEKTHLRICGSVAFASFFFFFNLIGSLSLSFCVSKSGNRVNSTSRWTAGVFFFFLFCTSLLENSKKRRRHLVIYSFFFLQNTTKKRKGVNTHQAQHVLKPFFFCLSFFFPRAREEERDLFFFIQGA